MNESITYVEKIKTHELMIGCLDTDFEVKSFVKMPKRTEIDLTNLFAKRKEICEHYMELPSSKEEERDNLMNMFVNINKIISLHLKIT